MRRAGITGPFLWKRNLLPRHVMSLATVRHIRTHSLSPHHCCFCVEAHGCKRKYGKACTFSYLEIPARGVVAEGDPVLSRGGQISEFRASLFTEQVSGQPGLRRENPVSTTPHSSHPTTPKKEIFLFQHLEDQKDQEFKLILSLVSDKPISKKKKKNVHYRSFANQPEPFLHVP